MKNVKLIKLLLCATLLTGTFIGLSPLNARAQQNFSYTQHMDNLTPLNQAYSLLDRASSVHTLVRQQYVGIEGSPKTFMFHLNLPADATTASMGLMVLNDQFGVETNTEISDFYAKSVSLNANSRLGVSLSAGIRKYSGNYSTLDPTDPSFTNDIHETKINVGFGIMYYSEKYYLGISVPQLSITTLGTASVQANNNFRNHYYFSGAYLATLSENIQMKPAVLASYVRGVPIIADISDTFYMKMLGVGFNFRTNGEIAGIVSVSLQKFRFGYSYQFGTSINNLAGTSNGTNEISVSYRFGKNFQAYTDRL